MTPTTIKLGQCFMARFAQNELPIRIEGNNPSGGWFSRALTHGHVVQVKDESQLLYKLTADEIRDIVRGVTPHRRSKIQSTVFRKPTTEATDEVVTNISLRKIKRMPFQRDIIVERLNILDAAERILNESKTPMTTREIIVAAKEKRYWISTASTPWATLHAAISRDIKTNKDNSRFTKKERGKFELK